MSTLAAQTTFDLDPVAAFSGMAADKDAYRVSYQAAEDIPFGRAVTLNSDGKVELPQDTTLTKVVGVAEYKADAEPGGYKAGDMVRVMRRGSIYADFTGGSEASLTKPNIMHSSTTPTNRGKFTMSGTSASSGVEISNAPEGVLMVKPSGISGLCLVELNLPA